MGSIEVLEELTMLKIVKTSLVIAATLGVSGVAQADVNEALANICTIVQADDKGELRKKMRSVESDYRMKKGKWKTRKKGKTKKTKEEARDERKEREQRK